MSDLAIGSSQLIKTYISGKVFGEISSHEKFSVTSFEKDVFFYCPEVNRECEQIEITSFSPTKQADYKLIITNVEIDGLFELNQNVYMNIGASKFEGGVIKILFRVQIVAFLIALCAFLVIRGAMRDPKTRLGMNREWFIG